MRIIVTGATGMLGADLVDILGWGNQVTGMDIGELDITDQDSTLNTIKELAPEIVINAAAYTNVDGCESNREQAFLVNAQGPRNLAQACDEAGAALVQVSTDYVFPGNSDRPYRENDPTGPRSVYGSSKLAGEEHVRALCSRHYIVRTSWLFGLNGNNFVKTVLRLVGERNLLTIVNDQTGSPTYTRDLAWAIARLITKPVYGIYHLTNSGTCTWYQFTREILQDAGVEGVEVKPVSSEELNRPAPRPVYSVMDNLNWRSRGYEPLRHYREALKEYLGAEKRLR